MAFLLGISFSKHWRGENVFGHTKTGLPGLILSWSHHANVLDFWRGMFHMLIKGNANIPINVIDIYLALNLLWSSLEGLQTHGIIWNGEHFIYYVHHICPLVGVSQTRLADGVPCNETPLYTRIWITSPWSCACFSLLPRAMVPFCNHIMFSSLCRPKCLRKNSDDTQKWANSLSRGRTLWAHTSWRTRFSFLCSCFLYWCHPPIETGLLTSWLS